MATLYQARDYSRLNGVTTDLNSPSELGRSHFRKDYARLLHAPSFRRLQGKTQLFPGKESDFFRNRLTHSLEVSQIASGIAEAINSSYDEFKSDPIDRDLLQFAGLAHDLGHPPFGHNGEMALDEQMKAFGGFEGNAQTLRILTNGERKQVRMTDGTWSSDFGLNLTYRSLASILKYDNKITLNRALNSKLEKGYYYTEEQFVRAIKEHVVPGYSGEKFKTIECSIMDIADDIAYSTYDLEDSMHAGFVTPFTLLTALFNQPKIRETVFKKTNDALERAEHDRLPDEAAMLKAALDIFDFSALKKHADNVHKDEDGAIFFAAQVRAFDQTLATNSLVRTQFTAERVGRLIRSVELRYNPTFPPLSEVRLNRVAILEVEILKHLNYELVIRSPRLAVVEYRGKDIVTQIFNAILRSEGDLLPDDWKDDYFAAVASKEQANKYRVICEFVAGMTDRYAIEFHSALFGEGKSLYNPL